MTIRHSSLSKYQTDLVENVGSLIDHASIEPDFWMKALQEFNRHVPSSKIGLQVVDIQIKRGLPAIAVGFDPKVVEDYAHHYGTINPWMPYMINAPSLSLLHSEYLLPANEFRNTEFYTDWLSKGGGIDASTAIKIVDSDGRFGMLNVHYESGRATEMHQLLAPVLKKLMHRIRRTLDINRLTDNKLLGQHVNPLFNAISEPAFIIKDDYTVVEANSAAHIFLSDHPFFIIGARNKLTVRSNIVRGSLDDETNHRSIYSNELNFVRQKSVLKFRDFIYYLEVIPLDFDLLSIMGFARLFIPRSLKLLIIRVHTTRHLDISSYLFAEYRMTQAEIDIIHLLDGRKNLIQIAAELRINYETARSRLKRVFVKTQTSRQSELIALLSKISNDLNMKL